MSNSNANSTAHGRTAIVTGASRGFGLALTRALVEHGWHVIVDARDPEALRRAVADLASADAVVLVAGDVTDGDHRRRLIDAAISSGRLDLVVNNASTLGRSPQPVVADLTPFVVRRIFDVNVFAPLELCRLALPLLRRTRGTIVNVTSDAATGGYPGWGGYGSSKAALDAFSDVLAAEEPDVRVIRFDPGDMNTRMHQDAFPGEDISDRPPPEASVPPLLALIAETAPSGAYAASAVAVP